MANPKGKKGKKQKENFFTAHDIKQFKAICANFRTASANNDGGDLERSIAFNNYQLGMLDKMQKAQPPEEKE